MYFNKKGMLNVGNYSRTKPYLVYRHTSPSNKVYIGITCEAPNARWGNDGSGYFENAHFRNAIRKYGWDNFKHEILYENLTLDEAWKKERELIRFHDAMNPDHGYNLTSGGEGGTQLCEESRMKISHALKLRWQNPEFRNHFSEIMQGRSLDPETIEKIRESNRAARKLVLTDPVKYHNWHESLKNRGDPWNKGKVGVFHHTEEAKKRIGDASRGKHLSEEHKKKLSVAFTGRFVSDETREKLRQAGLNTPQERRDRISATVKQRWKEGSYDNRAPRLPATDEYRQKMRELGKKLRPVGSFHHSEETKAKISKKLKGRKAHNRKAVQCVETGEVFETLTKAQEILHVSNISGVLDRPDRTAGKLHFITYHPEEVSSDG